MYLLITVLCLLLLNKHTLSEIQKTCETCKCSKLNNITIVNCANLNNPNILQYWPGSEKHLIISFANNKIQHLKQIPKTQSDTISLSLKNCSIEEVDNNLFIQAVNIEYVDLSYNFLKYEDLSGNVFRGPYNNESYEPIGLREINLSYNQINNLDRYLFQHTPNLTYLNLSYNPIHVFTFDMWLAIGSLKNLNTLILSNTSLQEVSKDIILQTGVVSVKKLDISHNELKVLPEDFSILFPAVETLIINDNPIEELTNKTFIGKSLYTITRLKARCTTGVVKNELWPGTEPTDDIN